GVSGGVRCVRTSTLSRLIVIEPSALARYPVSCHTHVGRDVVRDDTKLRLAERDSSECRPAGARESIGACSRIRSVQNAPDANLTNTRRDLSHLFGRNAPLCHNGYIEPDILHAAVMPFDRVRENSECGVGGIIVPAR